MPGRPLKRAHAILIAAGLVLLTGYNIVRVVRAPPRLDALSSHDVVLEDRIEVRQSTGRRSMRSPYAILRISGARATIENLCFLWNCELSPQLAALHAGDHLRVWMSGSEIWQLDHDGELLLDYRQALDAHERSATRQETVLGALALALFATLAWVLLRRRPAKAMSGIVPLPSPTMASGNAKFRMSFRLDSVRGVNVSGTRSFTVGQHALTGPLLERFQDAARLRDRDAMLAALVESGVAEATARLTVDAILADPQRFGF